MIRVTTEGVSDVDRDRIVQWIRGLGIDPTEVRPRLAIGKGETEYELHLSRYVRDSEGFLIVDEAAEDVVTEPLVIGIGPSLPDAGWMKF